MPPVALASEWVTVRILRWNDDVTKQPEEAPLVLNDQVGHASAP
jgi:hypothetical protein